MSTSSGRRVEDLRATMDSIEHDAEQVVQLERTKKALPADDRALQGLSYEVEDLSRNIAREAAIEQELTSRDEDERRPN